MPDITDDEYNRLLGRAQIADFIEPIYNDPQLGRDARALIKKKYPHVQIPDYDLETRFNQRFDDEKRQREEAEQKKRDSEQQEEFKKTRSKVQKEYGFTEDGMKELEDFMVQHNVGDYEVAASYRASKNPKQSDANHSDGLWNHQKQDGFADIAKDPEGWARNEILGSIYKDQERNRGGR